MTARQLNMQFFAEESFGCIFIKRGFCRGKEQSEHYASVNGHFKNPIKPLYVVV